MTLMLKHVINLIIYKTNNRIYKNNIVSGINNSTVKGGETRRGGGGEVEK